MISRSVAALTLAPLRALFARRLRRFGDRRLRARLAEIGEAFTAGYAAALADGPETIAARLAPLDPELHGFAWEGAGMALALLDSVRGGRRLRACAEGPGERQRYMLHVGAGWALAAPWVSPRRLLAGRDPLLGPMMLDGYGFYRALFFPRHTLARHRAPGWPAAGERQLFDVGIGRRLWFLDTPDLAPVLRRVAGFPGDRQGAVWTGLGEACAFGGGRGEGAAEALRRAAGPFLPCVAQGAAFAAEVRERGGNPAPHTELACRVLCGVSATAAAAATRETAAAAAAPRDTAGTPAAPPPIEIWRRRLQARFA